MDNDICEWPLEPTIDEMADDELDVVSGGVSFSYGQIQWVYTQQKRADGSQH
jgi:type VI protein secretion system component Hcp